MGNDHGASKPRAVDEVENHHHARPAWCFSPIYKNVLYSKHLHKHKFPCFVHDEVPRG